MQDSHDIRHTMIRHSIGDFIFLGFLDSNIFSSRKHILLSDIGHHTSDVGRSVNPV